MNGGICLAAALALLLIAHGAWGMSAEKANSSTKPLGQDAKIVLLHHSTGGCIWQGGVPEWFKEYNGRQGTAYQITEQAFPKGKPYGWKNYPYDYWNIWVNHAGAESFTEEPTLEILTRQYAVIVFKHCFPVSGIKPDTGKGEVDSEEKRLENYKLQYAALKAKLREFPQTRFIVWTGAALAKSDEGAGKRAREFFTWVKNQWDEKGDNIFVWDFYKLETEGGLYLKPEYCAKPGDSHPGPDFSRACAPLLGQRIVDVIEGRGDSGSLTGK